MARVLIVDDEPLVRMARERALVDVGCYVDTAPHGLAALQCMRRRRPDLVLLDLQMPVMDGYQFRAAQLSDPVIADVPVIVVSATPGRDIVERIRPLAVLSKPTPYRQLVDAVRRHLGI
jgi:CheY-like chemotaxis protein